MKNKKTIIYVMAVLILSILFVFQLAACGKTPTPDDDNKEQTTYFMVRFNTNGGTSVKSIKIKKGEAITLPNSPTKEGYIFDGWYLDSSCVEALEEGYLVKKSITLYAKWKEATKPVEDYQVIFYVDGEVYFQATLKSGAVLTLPKTPTKEGYVFDGWYFDSDFLQAVNDNYVIIGNVSIYAKWKTAQASEECEHEPIADKGYSPTCTKPGLSDGTHCDKCGKVLVEQEEIPAIGHSLERHKAKAATCTEIGWEAYDTCKRDGCEYTTYVEIPALNHDIEHHEAKAATCTEIGWGAYDTCKRDGCEYTTYVEIPALNHDIEHHEAKAATCTEIGWEAYDTCKRDGCEYTTYVEIPALNHDIEHHEAKAATCTEIGWEAYDTCKRNGCGYTTYVEIPASHNLDENGVCAVCGYFDSGLAFTLNDDGESYSVSGIGNFTGTELVIPKVNFDTKPVTSIGDYAFDDCTDLSGVTIPDSVTSIGKSAFSGCTGLTSVIIPDSVTSIGSMAFNGCMGLTKITIPNSMMYIGYRAFIGCSHLVEVYNKSYLTIIAGSEDNGWVAYYAKNVYTEEGGSKLSTDEDGYVIYTDGAEKILICYVGASTNLVLPNDITSICTEAFYENSSLTSIIIPDRVVSIGEGAFCDCSGLTSVTIGTGIKSIGDAAFMYCSSLTNVIIPDSVTSIGASAFCGSGLTSVTIGNSVTRIGAGAFELCENLAEVKFCGTEAEWNAIEKGTDAFNGVSSEFHIVFMEQ